MSEEVENTPVAEPTLRESMAEAYKEVTSAPVENAVVEPVEAPTKEINQDDTQSSKETEEVAQTPAAIQAPVSWSDADKQIFAKLPPEAQAVLARRESERDKFVNQKSDEVSRIKQEYGGIDSALGMIEHVSRQHNLSKEQTVKELVGLYKDYERDPIGYLTRAAQSAGIDLQKLALGQIDPQQFQQKALAAELADVKNQLSQLTSKEEVDANQYAIHQIQDFASKPENKFYEQVKDDMALLLQAEKAQDLPTAYEMACRLNPEIFAEVQKEKAAAAAKSKTAKALQAKQAGGPRLRTSEISDVSKGSSTSIRDTMREVYAELNGSSAA